MKARGSQALDGTQVVVHTRPGRLPTCRRRIHFPTHVQSTIRVKRSVEQLGHQTYPETGKFYREPVAHHAALVKALQIASQLCSSASASKFMRTLYISSHYAGLPVPANVDHKIQRLLNKPVTFFALEGKNAEEDDEEGAEEGVWYLSGARQYIGVNHVVRIQATFSHMPADSGSHCNTRLLCTPERKATVPRGSGRTSSNHSTRILPRDSASKSNRNMTDT